MSFPKYPAYKDSAVEWLGEVPEHWAIFSLKRSVDGCTNGLWGDEPDGENDLAVIRVADFDRATCRVGLDKLTYRSITQKERASRLLQSGDLLIEKSGGGEKTLVGCVVLFEHEFQAITSNFVARMRPLPSLDSGFLCYAFDSLYQGKVNFPAIKQTTGIQNLDSESYLQERFCFPTLAEQAQIARFLDYETARIDTLIEEQQRLIELLKEKRQAVISHAVTKGLDSTVPMKDSGVEWLGEVPAHWELKKLRHIGHARNGLTYSPEDVVDFSDSATLVLRSSNIQKARISLEDNVYVEKRIPEALRVREGDLLICSRNGSRALIGKNALIPKELDGQSFGAFMMVFRSEVNEFIYWVLNSPIFDYQSSTFLTATINQLTNENLGGMLAPFPPPAEQAEIVLFLTEKTQEIDILISEVQGGVELLYERRSALISAAVTGKIDVRGWQPPVSTQAPESAVAEAV